MKQGLIVTAVTIALAGAAAAQTIPVAGIDYADADDDGLVTLEEFETGIGAFFDMLDTNGDSAINRSEGSVTLTRELFDAADTDGSGWISRREFADQVKRDFTAADTDGDGVLE